MELAGKVALVTGASRGIGEATAMALARRGVRLLLVARSEADLRRVAAACEAAGSPRALPIVADLGELAGLDKVMLESVRQTDGFDILVNNAGYGMAGPLVDATDAQFDRMVAVNLRAPFMLSQGAVKVMRRRGGGQIVQVASGLAYRGSADWSLYAATKFGLRGFTECLRLEVAREGIKAGIVAPGYVHTAFHEGLEAQGGLTRTQQGAPSPGRAPGAGGLHPEDVVHAIMALIMQPAGSDIKEIVVRYPESPNG